MMMNSTQNDEYPIVYYRGDVNNNNVIYAGYCWLIVRTTETGGVKLIYNGTPYKNNDGALSCNNYSNVTVEGVNSGVTPTQALPEPGQYNDYYKGAYIYQETFAFNTNYNSPVYVGYMYNDDNLYYADGALDVDGYKSHLEDNTLVSESEPSVEPQSFRPLTQATIDPATGNHVQNKYSSNVKMVIDSWYQSEIEGTSAEDLLEDTVWCADRSVTSTNLPIENYATNEGIFMYSASTRLGVESVMNPEITSTIAPSLACSRDMDKFTVDSANGNGDLTYPIGMPTADEILMAGNTLDQGNTVITYLSIPDYYFWSLSPSDFSDGRADAFGVAHGGLFNVRVDFPFPGVRASVSLSMTAKPYEGNGSFEFPYNFDGE